MPRARANAETQVRQRMEVLALDALDPRPNNVEIARIVSKSLNRDVNVSTVRSILKVFKNRNMDTPVDNKRPGRPQKFNWRMKRCAPLFLEWF